MVFHTKLVLISYKKYAVTEKISLFFLKYHKKVAIHECFTKSSDILLIINTDALVTVAVHSPYKAYIADCAIGE